MSSNIKVTILGLFLLAIAATVMYFFYFSTETYTLLNEAEALYARGDIQAAHSKAEQALAIDMLNRRAIALKSELYTLVQDDNNFKEGMLAYEEGQALLRRGELTEASQKLSEAINKFNSITKKAEQYQTASTVVTEIMKVENEVLEDISQKHYSSAMWLYRSGELGRAYEQLRQAPSETADIKRLKIEIAYGMGLKRYNEIKQSPTSYGKTYYNDANYWLAQVPKGSLNYEDAQRMINELRSTMNNE